MTFQKTAFAVTVPQARPLMAVIQRRTSALTGFGCVVLKVSAHILGCLSKGLQRFFDCCTAAFRALAELSTGLRHDGHERGARLTHLGGEFVAGFRQVFAHTFQGAPSFP